MFESPKLKPVTISAYWPFIEAKRGWKFVTTGISGSYLVLSLNVVELEVAVLLIVTSQYYGAGEEGNDVFPSILNSESWHLLVLVWLNRTNLKIYWVFISKLIIPLFN